MKNFFKLLLLSTLSTSSLFAHGLWINSFEANSHGTNLVTIGLGTGHNLSIEDSISDRIQLDSFDLTTPNGENIALKKPLKAVQETYDKNGLNIIDSNLAMQKITLGKKSAKGTYSVNLATKEGTFTKYLDKNDKVKFTRKAKDKIRSLQKIISITKSTTYAKTYFVNKKWTQPKSVGHNLEIIPINDISKLYIGDTIKFKVLYEGKPLNSGYMTAKNSLSKADNALFSRIRKGQAKFVLTNYGQWKFNITNKKNKDGIIFSQTASATINIK